MVTPEEKLAEIENKEVETGNIAPDEEMTNEGDLVKVKQEEPEKCENCGNETFKVYDTYTSCLKCGKNTPLFE